MPHIHTNPGDHDTTVSSLIIRTDHSDGEPRMMLHMHRKLNVYMQFGGHVEANENPWQALAHELREESGYNIAQFKIAQPKFTINRISQAIQHPLPVTINTHSISKAEADHFHTDSLYLLVTNQEPEGSPADGESEDIVLLTQGEIQNLEDRLIFPGTRDIALFCFKGFYLSQWDLVETIEFSQDQPPTTAP